MEQTAQNISKPDNGSVYGSDTLTKKDFLNVTLAFLLSRLFFYGLVYFSLINFPTTDSFIHKPFFASKNNIVTDTMQGLCRFDCVWFETIALDGYELYPDHLTTGHAANWAFLPLYPSLGRILGFLTGTDVLTGFFLVTNIAFFIALLLWVKFLKLFRFSEELRTIGLLFLCFLPYSTYYLAPYTESLFLMFSLGAFIMAYKEKYLWAAVFAMGMTATKNIGIMFVFPLTILFIMQNGFKNLFNIKSLKTNAFWLAIMLVPLPMFLFQTYLWNVTGDALAFKDIQIAWGRMMGNPFHHMVKAFATGGYKAYFATAFVLSFGMIALLAWKKRFAESFYLLLGVLIPVSTGINAVTRYMFGMLPLLLAFMYLFEMSRLVRNLILGISGAIAIYILVAWTHSLFFTV